VDLSVRQTALGPVLARHPQSATVLLQAADHKHGRLLLWRTPMKAILS